MTSTLAALQRDTTRTKTLRVVLYQRQSKERERTISFEIQDESQRAWLAAHPEAVVVAVVRDEDRTGRNMRRPGIQEVLGYFQRREADVVLVWKFSRFSRNLRDSVVALADIEAAKGAVISATQNIDRDSTTGIFTWQMMMAIAEMESNQIGDVWKDTLRNRVAKGVPANGGARYGYQLIEVDHERQYVPHPITGPVLAELYRRRIAGEGWNSLMEELNERGVPTLNGGKWRTSTMRTMLDSGFGAGKIIFHGKHRDGAHPAVITEAEWEQYRASRDRTSRHGERQRSVSLSLLSGLIHCNTCGARMHANASPSNPMYRCPTRPAHPGSYIGMELADAAVLEWLHGEAAALEAAAAAAPAPTVAPALDRTPALRARLAQLDARLDAALVKHLDAPDLMPEAQYRRLAEATTLERADVEFELAQAEAEAFLPPVESTLTTLAATWDELIMEERRELLRRVIFRVVAVPGRPRGTVTVEPR